MNQTLTTNQAADQLASCYDGSNFSYAGAYALVEWLEELEEGTDEPVEFNPIALCCEFSEYPSLVDWAEEYFMNWHEEFGLSFEDEQTGEERIQVVVDEDGDYLDEVLDAIQESLHNNAILIEFDGGIIVRGL